MTVYDLIMEELLHRGCAYVERFPPYYIASIGCHILNLANREAEFYMDKGGDVGDIRIHIIFSAPPGFSKTFWLNQFMPRGTSETASRHAILKNTGLDVTMEATLTGAGFVGTTRFNQGESIREPGLAELHSQALIGIEEFSAVTSMFKTAHSGELDNALLLALDSGYVYKRLAAGPIKYRTHVTLWTGSQPMRFDLSSGLGRRFVFIEFMPTTQDFLRLRSARREGIGKTHDPIRTDRIRDEIRSLIVKASSIRKIEIDPRFYEWVDEFDQEGQNIWHIQEVLLERFLLGLAFMRNGIRNWNFQRDALLYAEFDDVAKYFCEMLSEWRYNVTRGSEYSQVMIILEDLGGKAPKAVIRNRLLDYGMDFGQATELLYTMSSKLKMIIEQGSFIHLPGYKEKKK